MDVNSIVAPVSVDVVKSQKSIPGVGKYCQISEREDVDEVPEKRPKTDKVCSQQDEVSGPENEYLEALKKMNEGMENLRRTAKLLKQSHAKLKAENDLLEKKLDNLKIEHEKVLELSKIIEMDIDSAGKGA